MADTNIGTFTPKQAKEILDTIRLLKTSGILRQKTENPRLDDPLVYPVSIKNDSGEEIPPFACMQITNTTIEGVRTVLDVIKPDTLEGKYIFNHRTPIESGGFGVSLPWDVVRMKGNTTAEANKDYAPVVGQWYVEKKDGGPFVVYGDDGTLPNTYKGRFNSISSDTKIFRSPTGGIGSAAYDDVADEITAAILQCQEYVWNADSSKLIALTTSGIVTALDPTPAPIPVTFSVANPFFGRVPAFICIPPGFDEGAELCEGVVPDVPELDPPCDTDVRNEVPYFFMAVKKGPHYVPIKPLIPTKRVHLLQRPQLVEDYLGNKEITFPLYEARIEAPLHDGCAPLQIAACGPTTLPVPCVP